MQIAVDSISVTVLMGSSGGMLAACITMAWKVVKRLNRDETLRADYPPHRHINGKIVYPHDYTPSAVGHIHHAGD